MKKGVLLLFTALILSFNALSQEKPKNVKDDPINRVIYEHNMLVNPVTGKIPDNIKEEERKFIKSQNFRKNLKGTKATNWVHRGPFNVGGRTRALAIDVSSENIILAAGVSGGMWRSTDGGSSWTKTTASSDLHSITAIAQDTRSGHTNIWYYTTGERLGNSAGDAGALYRGNGLFKSIDNGISWFEIVSTTANSPQSLINNFQYCWNVKVNPQNAYVYVASYGMIFRSIDGGDSWLESLSGEPPIFNESADYTDIELSSTGIIYATLSNNTVNQGIFRSIDGLSWTDITPDDMPVNYNRIVLDIAASDEDLVYFLANTPGSGINNHSLWKYQYLSGDGSGVGGIWTNLSNQIPDLGGFSGDFDSQNSYDLLIKIKPDDENFVIIGGVNLFRSTDGFNTTENTAWIGGYTPSNDSNDSYSYHHADQHSLVFYNSNPDKVISGHDGGLSLTNNINSDNVGLEKVSWTYLNTGYLTTQAYAIAIDQENFNDNKILAGFQDNGTWSTNSADGFVSWESILDGDGAYCAFGNEGLSWYSSFQYGVIYIDVYDFEGDYDYWTRVDPNGAANPLFLTPFVLDPNNTNIMYYQGGDIIWRNSDLTGIPKFSNNSATTNWTSMLNSKITGSTITAISISKTPANTLYYGGANGKLFKTVGAAIGDPNSVEITDSRFPEGNIGCIYVNPKDAMEIFVTFTNYSIVSIWHSIDGGQSWESISGNLEENQDGSGSGPSVRWFSILEIDTNNHIYFVATSIGLLSTTLLDGDNTFWTQEAENTIGNVVVTMIKTRADGTVVVGTHANGVYSTQYDVGVSTKENKFINSVKAKVYPNPSNGIFNIEVKGEYLADYHIAIYDMYGKAVYFSKQKNVLSINQQIDLQKHAKGIYNVEIVKDGRASSYKVVLK